MVHMVRKIPLGWLAGVESDIPAAVLAESGGPGDDIRLELENGAIVEAQVKRGLQAGAKLWESLLALADGLSAKQIQAGVLVVCPNSSRSIRDALANDIVRIGSGRTDSLGPLGKELVKRLTDGGHDAAARCARIRIATLQALPADGASISAALAQLHHVCVEAEMAWTLLTEVALALIAGRGRRTADDVVRLWVSRRIELRPETDSESIGTPSQVAAWALASNREFSVLGMPKALPLDSAWIELEAAVLDEPHKAEETLEKALQSYHAGDGGRSNRSEKTDASTIGRFVRRSVIVAGPGLGKTTVLAVLARSYASDAYAVLSVRLPMVAVRMREQGAGFEEAVVSLGLDGSGISGAELRRSGLDKVVLLCDGLDECGRDQASIAKSLVTFSAGHPTSRIVVATRPIGYDCKDLLDWRHYRILPLEESQANLNIAKLIGGVLDPASESFKEKMAFAKQQLEAPHVKRVAARSPMLLGFIASLSYLGKSVGASKGDLYRQLFTLIEQAPSSRPDRGARTSAVMVRVLEMLGHVLVSCPNEMCSASLERCAQLFRFEQGGTVLKARELVERSVLRWQDLGMLERVRFGAEEVVTFIHKTFGEYAAARYLIDMPAEERDSQLAARIGEPGWSEVLAFSSASGLAEPVIRATLGWPALDQDPRLVERALDWVVEAEPRPDPELVKRLISAAWKAIDSDRRSHALRLGDSLCDLSASFPQEVDGAARDFLRSGRPWARLVAWACVATSGEACDRRELIEVVEGLGALVQEPATLTDGLNLFGRNTRVARHFVLGAARRILAFEPMQSELELLDVAVKMESLQTFQFIHDVRSLFKSHGRVPPIDYSPGLATSFMSDEDLAGWRKEQLHLLELLDDPATREASDLDRDPSKEELLAMSAFLDASGYMHLTGSAVSDFRSSGDGHLFRELFRVVCAVSGIDAAKVARAAKLRRKSLSVSTDKFSSLFSDMPRVDTAPEWVTSTPESSLATIERGMMATSQWIVLLAAQILQSFSFQEQLPTVLRRLLTKGEGDTLWAATALASELPTDVCISLLVEGISRPVVPGSQHVFSKLAELDPSSLGTVTLEMLQTALLGTGPRTATAAARLAGKVPTMPGLGPLVRDAYEHWLRAESPYPKAVGIVPDSPRAELTKRSAELGLLSDDEVLRRCSDDRWDIKEVARTFVEGRLKLSEDFRDMFLTAVESGNASPGLLTSSLRSLCPYSAGQVNRILGMLSNPLPTIRYAAIELLRAEYLGMEVIIASIDKLLADSEISVREKAAELRAKQDFCPAAVSPTASSATRA
jgi:hypothetical protein